METKQELIKRSFSSVLSGSRFKKNEFFSQEQIVEMLQTTPEALEAFEKAYQIEALDQVSENFFEVNAKQAKEQVQRKGGTVDPALIDRIVRELLEATPCVTTYDGKDLLQYKPDAKGASPVDPAELICIPKELRPQLTGKYASRDLHDDSYPVLLYYWSKYKETGNIRFYHRFRQGLDILDMDPVVYEMIGMNPNSMGFWFPALVEAVKSSGFFQIPKTTIVKLPVSMLQLTRLDYENLTAATIQIVDQYCQKVFKLDPRREYFVKTGTYSSKFDFRNAYVHGEQEVRELGEYLLFIHFQALMMASPLSKPSIYGVSTTNEWVVREFIPDKEENPCIYKGLSLHTEYRVFVDCDTDEVLGIVPYWEPETMKRRFSHLEDSDSLHQMHDYAIYRMHERTLMGRYQKNRDRIVAEIEAVLPDIHLPGQWSIDIMQNGEAFWIIDMALAENSAFSNCIPEEKRKPVEEKWIPKLQFRS